MTLDPSHTATLGFRCDGDAARPRSAARPRPSRRRTGRSGTNISFPGEPSRCGQSRGARRGGYSGDIVPGRPRRLEPDARERDLSEARLRPPPFRRPAGLVSPRGRRPAGATPADSSSRRRGTEFAAQVCRRLPPLDRPACRGGPRFVHHYFAGKTELFGEVMTLPVSPSMLIERLRSAPVTRSGVTIARSFFTLGTPPGRRRLRDPRVGDDPRGRCPPDPRVPRRRGLTRVASYADGSPQPSGEAACAAASQRPAHRRGAVALCRGWRSDRGGEWGLVAARPPPCRPTRGGTPGLTSVRRRRVSEPSRRLTRSIQAR